MCQVTKRSRRWNLTLKIFRISLSPTTKSKQFRLCMSEKLMGGETYNIKRQPQRDILRRTSCILPRRNSRFGPAYTKTISVRSKHHRLRFSAVYSHSFTRQRVNGLNRAHVSDQRKQRGGWMIDRWSRSTHLSGVEVQLSLLILCEQFSGSVSK